MTGLRYSEEDYQKLINGNKHLKVSSRSASRSQKAAGSASTATTATKPKGTAKARTGTKVSPHARELARLKKNPELMKGNEEHFIQVELLWILECDYPEIYRLTHSTPNSGKRGKLTAFIMQSEGQKAGYPDMTLDAARGVYHGLRVEVKTMTGKPSPDQLRVATDLRAEGYSVVFAYGLQAAKCAFLEYWNLQKGQTMPQELKP
jgi:hypothetical protein